MHLPACLPAWLSFCLKFKTNYIIFNQVFNENRVIVMLKLAAGGRAASGGRASTFGFRSITLVCFGLLTPNLLYG